MRSRGFTLIEVLVAIVVLLIGLVGVAVVLSNALSTSSRSRYMSLAGTLASEKLEDLNRWPTSDPHLAVTSGTSAGSLSSDLVANVTVGANITSVNYFDQVGLSAVGGAYSETVRGLDSSGNTVYTTTTHSPAGSITVTTSNTAPAVPVTFDRRWLIEANTPVQGVRRITVLVQSMGGMIQPPVTFQMSTVRP